VTDALARSLQPGLTARADLKAHLERLAREVDATRRDAGFLEALRTMARFWRYSVFNQFSIWAQRPTSTRVAGREAWASLGRKVRPGERPISILAPSRRKGGGVRFVAVEVFDVAQTRGRRLAELDLSLRGGSRHARTLERAAGGLGVEVAYEPLPPGAKGCSQGGRIVLLPGLPGRERVRVLAHELAHEVLHQAERKRAAELKRPGPALTHTERETEADASAYVVLAALGLPSKAPGYIAWQGGTGLAVLRSMTRIQRAARTILEATGDPSLAQPGPGQPARTRG
jgi:N-terminal domain of anti-restriction factor ArdC